MGAEPVIKLLAPGDGAVYRSVRLRALDDAPDAFGATLEREKELPRSAWEERLQHGATFVAVSDGQVVGVVKGLEKEDEDRVVQLASMWVDPAARGGKVGRHLIDVVVGWARERSAVQVKLWVVDGNDAALRLYQSRGFKKTGERQPLPSRPGFTRSCLIRWL